MTRTTLDNQEKYQVSPIVLLFKRIVHSREPFMVGLRYYLVIAAAVVGVKNMRSWVLFLSCPHIFHKDLLQDFLISKAVWSHVNPYLPVNKLADLFIAPLPVQVFPHPSPHPPPVALLSLPLGLLPYQHAAILWFLSELLCLSISIALLLRYLGVEKKLPLALLPAVLILVWKPIDSELVAGQWNSLLLLLFIGTWEAIRSRRDIRGGILLGSAIAVKLAPWPILIFLILHKNWRAACAAITTITIANGAAAMLMGIDRIAQYYFRVGNAVLQFYHATAGNFSLWTIGWRLFNGTSLQDWNGPNVPPLFTAPALAPWISIAIPLTMLIFGFFYAFKARGLDSSFGILICILILASPIAWAHFLILALIPLVIVLHNLSSLNWPPKETNIALCVGFTFFLSARQLMPLLNDNIIPNRFVPIVSFAIGALSLLPTVGLLGLLWLVWRCR